MADLNPFDERPPEESDLTTIFRPAKKTEWQKMNHLQKTGVGAGVIFCLLGFDETRLGLYSNLIGITALYFGYVLGSLVRVRHALHFWWSIIGSCALHAVLVPAYVRLTIFLHSQPHLNGRSYAFLLFGPVIAEVVLSILLFKRIALWQRRKRVPLRTPVETDVWGIWRG